jgi:putative PIN family toxin of toxin-antitoxin system
VIRSIVVDTNVLISAYLWKGKPREALKLIRSGGFRLLYCRQTIDELVRVLSLKFSLNATEIYLIVEDIRSMGKAIVVSSVEWPITADPTDNIFVNLALDAKADLIISGDSHLLRLNKFKNIRIVSVTEFLALHR